MLIATLKAVLLVLKDKFLELQSYTEDLELKLTLLQEGLLATFEEQSEIIEHGFSFSSSLKDISRYALVSLLEATQDINIVIFIICNWDSFVAALDNPYVLTPQHQYLIATFAEVYYGTVDYFKRQFLSHLGEKVEFDSNLITDPLVRSYVNRNGLRQRKFDYSLDSKDIQFIQSTTARTFEIKKTEREKVEMLNALFIRFILYPEQNNDLIALILAKFPELEDELTFLLESSLSIDLAPGQSLIEISPPYEDYSYQKDCMVRIYTFNGIGFNVTQYSIPYSKEEVSFAADIIQHSWGAQRITTATGLTFESNNLLGQFFLTDCSTPSILMNSFTSILEAGGIEVVEQADSILRPLIQKVGDQIHPFIVDYINSPIFFPLESNQAAERYKEVFLSAIATLDINIRNENTEVVNILESGELLNAAIHNQSTSDLLRSASNGAVSSLDVSANGYCDTVSGTIGERAITTSKEAYTLQEVGQMEFKGNITSLTKAGDLSLELRKYIDKDGNEKKLFECPICKARGNINYVDICASKCPECSVELSAMRKAAESNNLSNFVKEYDAFGHHTSGNGIFGVLFDLFGAIFNVFS